MTAYPAPVKVRFPKTMYKALFDFAKYEEKSIRRVILEIIKGVDIKALKNLGLWGSFLAIDKKEDYKVYNVLIPADLYEEFMKGAKIRGQNREDAILVLVAQRLAYPPVRKICEELL